MEWTAEVAAGEWLRDRLGAELITDMHAIVPRGYAAYARIFHPATRDRPVGRPWPRSPSAHDWAAFQAAQPEIDVERASWAQCAAAFGSVMHPLAQWEQLVGVDRYAGSEDGPRDAAGWRYSDPDLGQLPGDLMPVLAGHCRAVTATPDEIYVGVWEGWGGLVGATGFGPSRAMLTFARDGDPVVAVRHEEFLAHSRRDMFNDVFRKPQWQPGVLSDEISRGERLQLPGRAHVLFRGTITELADPDWARRAPWTDRDRLAQGFPYPAESPSLIWPADRAWVAATDVDWNFTVVGCGPELLESLSGDRRIEVMAVPPESDLSSTGDEVNR